mmetsp:Transcript_51995/g.129464  ORF Transcript_51995/g.129464 Transcript_51995/m.129464 type:complete len:473 (-) Transcript_51995:237-1655(-)
MAKGGEGKTAVVVGGGLVGCMTGVLLAKDGYTVKIFELREDYRSKASDASNSSLHGQLTNTTKRSINLALSHRGLCALRAAGLEDKVMREAVPMEGRMIHPAGVADCLRTEFQPYEHRPGMTINSISREELNTVLLEELESMKNVTIKFGAKFAGLSRGSGMPVFGSEEVHCDFVVGADGAFSKAREELGRLVRLDFERRYIKHGYKELNIPAVKAGTGSVPSPAGGDYVMPPKALHIWPRHEFMLIGLPNLDGSFTCTLFMPFEDLDKLKTDSDVVSFFKEYFPDIAANNFELMPSLLQDFFANPTSSLLSINCDPWHFKGSFVCLGDAMHATVPFYGQGMNAGFEDALRLHELLREHGHDRERAFAQFSEEMVPSRIGLCEVSLDNYVDMRSNTANPLFTIKKKLEWAIGDFFPSWQPIYTMVTFTRTPYHIAIQRAKKQDTILYSTLGVLGAGVLVGVGGILRKVLAAR